MEKDFSLYGWRSNAKACQDHTGKEFPSIRAMCRAWGVSSQTYATRLRRGYSIEQALAPIPPAIDHLGNKFPSLTAMCVKWGIPREVYYCRRYEGWSVEKSLTTPMGGKGKCSITDPETGYTYTSIAEAAAAAGITRAAMWRRVHRGLFPDLVFYGGNLSQTPSRDHTGKEFPSIRAMCRAWGISHSRYVYRINHGWSIEKALTTPAGAQGNRRNSRAVTVDGVTYPTIREACAATGVTISQMQDMMYKKNRSPEEAIQRVLDRRAQDITLEEAEAIMAKCRTVVEAAKLRGLNQLTVYSRISRGMTPAEAIMKHTGGREKKK